MLQVDGLKGWWMMDPCVCKVVVCSTCGDCRPKLCLEKIGAALYFALEKWRWRCAGGHEHRTDTVGLDDGFDFTFWDLKWVGFQWP